MYMQTEDSSVLHPASHSIDPLLSHLNDEQNAAKENGMRRYKLGEYLDAEAHLAIAATAGDCDSQYALGEAIRRREGSISDAAKAWYRMAGAQNHVYSLMRLGDAESINKARQLAQAGADLEDSDSLLQMYELTHDITWLKKAGNAGNAEADYIRALMLNQRFDAQPPDSSDARLIDALLRRSSDNGFPPAMYWLSKRPNLACNETLLRQIFRGRLDKNHLSAVVTFAYAVLRILSPETPERNNFRYNPTVGYGLLWLVVNRTQQYSGRAEAAQTLRKFEAELPSQTIEDGKFFALDWERKHPPMSVYALTYDNLA